MDRGEDGSGGDIEKGRLEHRYYEGEMGISKRRSLSGNEGGRGTLGKREGVETKNIKDY